MEKDFKAKLTEFKNSCRVYRREKELLQELKVRNPQIEFGTVRDRDLHRMLTKENAFVERNLARLRETGGEEAVQTITELFMDMKTQAEFCADHKVSRRQLQYSVDKWMREIFKDD